MHSTNQTTNDFLTHPWPKLGLGTGTLASLGRKSTLHEVRCLLAALMECGATLIDTADSYGSGDCEILLGKAMKDFPREFRIVTKSGYRFSNLPCPLRPLNQIVKKGMQYLGARQRFDPNHLKNCLENSLKRLGVDHLDAFLLHDPGIEVLQDEEILQACADLEQSGKTLTVGVSSGNPNVIHAAAESGMFSVIQSPANLEAAQSMRESWMKCSKKGIHLIGNHVYAPRCLELQGMHHETLMRACAGYMPGGSTILCGTRKPSHLKQSVAWAEDAMPHDQAFAIADKFFACTDLH